MEEPDVLQKPKNRSDPIRRTFDVNRRGTRTGAHHLGVGPAELERRGVVPRKTMLA